MWVATCSGFPVSASEVQCIWAWMLFSIKTIIIILPFKNCKWKMSLLSFRTCIWKCNFPPFVLLMDLEIKLHRCCFFFGSPCYQLCWSSTWSVPAPAQLHRWLSGDQVVAGLWQPRCCWEMGRSEIAGCFLTNASEKRLRFSHLRVAFCFILCKDSAKDLTICQKQFFWYLPRKMYVIIGVVFTWCGQDVLIFIMKKEEEGRRRKRKKSTVQ